MMLQWKTGLASFQEDTLQKVVDYYNSKNDDFSLSDLGEKGIKTFIRKYGAEKVIEAIDEAFKKYLNDTPDKENYEFIYGRVKALLHFNSLSPQDQSNWVRTSAVLKKCRAKFYRGGYGGYDYRQATQSLQEFLKAGYSIDALEDVTDCAETFAEWKNELRP